MKKDFQRWHFEKARINDQEITRYFYEKEIWWIAIGHNVRHEEDGKSMSFSRPVLIFRKFNRFIFFGIPLSTTKNRGKYYYPFTYKDNVESVALLSQLRVFDSNRLIRKDGNVKDKDYLAIQRKLSEIVNEEPRK